MTSPLAIAAVTARLRNLLAQSLEVEVPGIEVTTLPLNQANETIPDNGRVNLCLYEVGQNAHWRNGDIPWQVHPLVKPVNRPSLSICITYSRFFMSDRNLQ